MQQAQMMQQQAVRQRQQQLLQQQFQNMPMGMPNGINPQMTAAQFQAMRGAPNMRPVALPPHLQQQQQHAQLGLEQQQAAQQQQAQQQHQVSLLNNKCVSALVPMLISRSTSNRY
jgi:hypothetical protein